MVKCVNCGSNDEEVRLLKFAYKGKEDYVCLKCLPIFIHGTH